MKLGKISSLDRSAIGGDSLVFSAHVVCDCGREWWEGDNYCPRCGRKLPKESPAVITAKITIDELNRIGEERIREKVAALGLEAAAHAQEGGR